MQRWLRLALPVALSGCASSATSAESATDAGSGLCPRVEEANTRFAAAFAAARACDPDVASSCVASATVRELCGCDVPAGPDAALRAAALSARDDALEAIQTCNPLAGAPCDMGCRTIVRVTCERTGPTTGICTFAP